MFAAQMIKSIGKMIKVAEILMVKIKTKKYNTNDFIFSYNSESHSDAEHIRESR